MVESYLNLNFSILTVRQQKNFKKYLKNALKNFKF